jgi:glucose/arabinose dehydrogenase
LQKVFAYGVRNSFGMAFDPLTGNLWDQQNGDDAFDELNLVEPGANLGWIQVMGPIARVDQFVEIESSLATDPITNTRYEGMQQLRWPATNNSRIPSQALSRLFMIPGAHYSDPEFSWKYSVAPAAIGFVSGTGLGPQYEGDLVVGASRTTLAGGYLFRFRLTGNGTAISPDDPRVQDLVADNSSKFDITESEEFLFGRNFGVGTDIQTGPNGNLFVVSLTNGAIYEIYRRPVPVTPEP